MDRPEDTGYELVGKHVLPRRYYRLVVLGPEKVLVDVTGRLGCIAPLARSTDWPRMCYLGKRNVVRGMDDVWGGY